MKNNEYNALLQSTGDILEKTDRPYILILVGDNENHVITNCVKYKDGESLICETLREVAKNVENETTENNEYTSNEGKITHER